MVVDRPGRLTRLQKMFFLFVVAVATSTVYLRPWQFMSRDVFAATANLSPSRSLLAIHALNGSTRTNLSSSIASGRPESGEHRANGSHTQNRTNEFRTDFLSKWEVACHPILANAEKSSDQVPYHLGKQCWQACTDTIADSILDHFLFDLQSALQSTYLIKFVFQKWGSFPAWLSVPMTWLVFPWLCVIIFNITFALLELCVGVKSVPLTKDSLRELQKKALTAYNTQQTKETLQKKWRLGELDPFIKGNFDIRGGEVLDSVSFGNNLEEEQVDQREQRERSSHVMSLDAQEDMDPSLSKRTYGRNQEIVLADFKSVGDTLEGVLWQESMPLGSYHIVAEKLDVVDESDTVKRTLSKGAVVKIKKVFLSQDKATIKGQLDSPGGLISIANIGMDGNWSRWDSLHAEPDAFSACANQLRCLNGHQMICVLAACEDQCQRCTKPIAYHGLSAGCQICSHSCSICQDCIVKHACLDYGSGRCYECAISSKSPDEDENESHKHSTCETCGGEIDTWKCSNETCARQNCDWCCFEKALESTRKAETGNKSEKAEIGTWFGQQSRYDVNLNDSSLVLSKNAKNMGVLTQAGEWLEIKEALEDDSDAASFFRIKLKEDKLYVQKKANKVPKLAASSGSALSLGATALVASSGSSPSLDAPEAEEWADEDPECYRKVSDAHLSQAKHDIDEIRAKKLLVNIGIQASLERLEATGDRIFALFGVAYCFMHSWFCCVFLAISMVAYFVSDEDAMVGKYPWIRPWIELPLTIRDFLDMHPLHAVTGIEDLMTLHPLFAVFIVLLLFFCMMCLAGFMNSSWTSLKKIQATQQFSFFRAKALDTCIQGVQASVLTVIIMIFWVFFGGFCTFVFAAFKAGSHYIVWSCAKAGSAKSFGWMSPSAPYYVGAFYLVISLMHGLLAPPLEAKCMPPLRIKRSKVMFCLNRRDTWIAKYDILVHGGSLFADTNMDVSQSAIFFLRGAPFFGLATLSGILIQMLIFAAESIRSGGKRTVSVLTCVLQSDSIMHLRGSWNQGMILSEMLRKAAREAFGETYIAMLVALWALFASKMQYPSDVVALFASVVMSLKSIKFGVAEAMELSHAEEELPIQASACDKALGLALIPEDDYYSRKALKKSRQMWLISIFRISETIAALCTVVIWVGCSSTKIMWAATYFAAVLSCIVCVLWWSRQSHEEVDVWKVKPTVAVIYADKPNNETKYFLGYALRGTLLHGVEEIEGDFAAVKLSHLRGYMRAQDLERLSSANKSEKELQTQSVEVDSAAHSEEEDAKNSNGGSEPMQAAMASNEKACTSIEDFSNVQICKEFLVLSADGVETFSEAEMHRRMKLDDLANKNQVRCCTSCFGNRRLSPLGCCGEEVLSIDTWIDERGLQICEITKRADGMWTVEASCETDPESGEPKKQTFFGVDHGRHDWLEFTLEGNTKQKTPSLKLKFLSKNKMEFCIEREKEKKAEIEKDCPADWVMVRRILTRQDVEGYWDNGIIIGDRLIREDDEAVDAIELTFDGKQRTSFSMVVDGTKYKAKMLANRLEVTSCADYIREIWLRQAHVCKHNHRLRILGHSGSYSTAVCSTCKLESNEIAWCRECCGTKWLCSACLDKAQETILLPGHDHALRFHAAGDDCSLCKERVAVFVSNDRTDPLCWDCALKAASFENAEDSSSIHMTYKDGKVEAEVAGETYTEVTDFILDDPECTFSFSGIAASTGTVKTHEGKIAVSDNDSDSLQKLHNWRKLLLSEKIETQVQPWEHPLHIVRACGIGCCDGDACTNREVARGSIIGECRESFNSKLDQCQWQCASCLDAGLGKPCGLEAVAVNDEGAPVKLGAPGYEAAHLYYCGRNLGEAAIPDSDGRCGPNDGPQCASCQRFQASEASSNFKCQRGHNMKKEPAWTLGTCDVCNKAVSDGELIRTCKECDPEYWVCEKCEKAPHSSTISDGLDQKLVGISVVRGPRWEYGDEDGGFGTIGRTCGLNEEGWMKVRWADGKIVHDGYQVIEEHMDLQKQASRFLYCETFLASDVDGNGKWVKAGDRYVPKLSWDGETLLRCKDTSEFESRGFIRARMRVLWKTYVSKWWQKLVGLDELLGTWMLSSSESANTKTFEGMGANFVNDMPIERVGQFSYQCSDGRILVASEAEKDGSVYLVDVADGGRSWMLQAKDPALGKRALFFLLFAIALGFILTCSAVVVPASQIMLWGGYVLRAKPSGGKTGENIEEMLSSFEFATSQKIVWLTILWTPLVVSFAYPTIMEHLIDVRPFARNIYFGLWSADWTEHTASLIKGILSFAGLAFALSFSYAARKLGKLRETWADIDLKKADRCAEAFLRARGSICKAMQTIRESTCSNEQLLKEDAIMKLSNLLDRMGQKSSKEEANILQLIAEDLINKYYGPEDRLLLETVTVDTRLDFDKILLAMEIQEEEEETKNLELKLQGTDLPVAAQAVQGWSLYYGGGLDDHVYGDEIPKDDPEQVRMVITKLRGLVKASGSKESSKKKEKKITAKKEHKDAEESESKTKKARGQNAEQGKQDAQDAGADDKLEKPISLVFGQLRTRLRDSVKPKFLSPAEDAVRQFLTAPASEIFSVAEMQKHCEDAVNIMEKGANPALPVAALNEVRNAISKVADNLQTLVLFEDSEDVGVKHDEVDREPARCGDLFACQKTRCCDGYMPLSTHPVEAVAGDDGSEDEQSEEGSIIAKVRATTDGSEKKGEFEDLYNSINRLESIVDGVHRQALDSVIKLPICREITYVAAEKFQLLKSSTLSSLVKSVESIAESSSESGDTRQAVSFLAKVESFSIVKELLLRCISEIGKVEDDKKERSLIGVLDAIKRLENDQRSKVLDSLSREDIAALAKVCENTKNREIEILGAHFLLLERQKGAEHIVRIVEKFMKGLEDMLKKRDAETNLLELMKNKTLLESVYILKATCRYKPVNISFFGAKDLTVIFSPSCSGEAFYSIGKERKQFPANKQIQIKEHLFESDGSVIVSLYLKQKEQDLSGKYFALVTPTAKPSEVQPDTFGIEASAESEAMQVLEKQDGILDDLQGGFNVSQSARTYDDEKSLYLSRIVHLLAYLLSRANLESSKAKGKNKNHETMSLVSDEQKETSEEKAVIKEDLKERLCEIFKRIKQDDAAQDIWETSIDFADSQRCIQSLRQALLKAFSETQQAHCVEILNVFQQLGSKAFSEAFPQKHEPKYLTEIRQMKRRIDEDVESSILGSKLVAVVVQSSHPYNFDGLSYAFKTRACFPEAATLSIAYSKLCGLYDSCTEVVHKPSISSGRFVPEDIEGSTIDIEFSTDGDGNSSDEASRTWGFLAVVVAKDSRGDYIYTEEQDRGETITASDDAQIEAAPRCQNGHALQQFLTDRDGFSCDLCKNKFPKGAAMVSCRQCNYDQCQACTQASPVRDLAGKCTEAADKYQELHELHKKLIQEESFIRELIKQALQNISDSVGEQFEREKMIKAILVFGIRCQSFGAHDATIDFLVNDSLKDKDKDKTDFAKDKDMLRKVVLPMMSQSKAGLSQDPIELSYRSLVRLNNLFKARPSILKDKECLEALLGIQLDILRSRSTTSGWDLHFRHVGLPSFLEVIFDLVLQSDMELVGKSRPQLLKQFLDVCYKYCHPPFASSELVSKIPVNLLHALNKFEAPDDKDKSSKQISSICCMSVDSSNLSSFLDGCAKYCQHSSNKIVKEALAASIVQVLAKVLCRFESIKALQNLKDLELLSQNIIDRVAKFEDEQGDIQGFAKSLQKLASDEVYDKFAYRASLREA